MDKNPCFPIVDILVFAVEQDYEFFQKEIHLNSHTQCFKSKAIDSSFTRSEYISNKGLLYNRFKVCPAGSDSHTLVTAVSFLCRLFCETLLSCNFSTSEVSGDKNQLSTFQIC